MGQSMNSEYDRRGLRPMMFREDGVTKEKRPKALRRTTRAWKYKALEKAVRDYISSGRSSVCVEMIAWELRAKPGMVKKALYQMVREGLIHAPNGHRGWSWKPSWWMRRSK